MSQNKFWCLIITIALTGFLVIGYMVNKYGSLPFDAGICDAVYAIRNPALTLCFKAITYIANWQTVTLICIIMLFFKPSRRSCGYPLAAAAIASSILYKGMKEIFERPRPDVSLRLVVENGFSFPSGHSMTGLVFYGLLVYLLTRNMKNRKTANVLTALSSIMIALIGTSRVYLGVHYPSDVIGGFCLGTALLFLILFCERAYNTSVKKDTL